MQFGISLPLHRSVEAQVAGFDFLETDVGQLVRPDLPDDQWAAPPPTDLPVLAAYGLVPPQMKISGPEVDLPSLRALVHRVTERAGRLGVRVIALDSAASLTVPDDFDHKQAKRQRVEFLRTALPFFARYEVLLVAGPQRPTECNVLTTLPDVLQCVWEVDHPYFQCMLDAEHFVEQSAPPEQVRDALPWIRHARFGPLEEGEAPSPADPALSALREYKYDGAITLVARDQAIRETLCRLKLRWSELPG